MNIAQIESNLQNLIKSLNKDTFIFDLLLAYGLPKSSIARLQKGNLNLSKNAGETIWKKKLHYKACWEGELQDIINTIAKDKLSTKHDPRFILVTDFKSLVSIDTKTKDKLHIELKDILRHYDFFLPWAGKEKYQIIKEQEADVKAAEKMGKLYDQIKQDNPANTKEEVHNLNVFLSRLLFCFFAEDTGIFEKALFTNAISSHTQADGKDLNTYLDKLFEVMNTSVPERSNLPFYLDAFPYVNGGLFRNKHYAPAFTRRSRQAIIDNGELDWHAINPDIFGSMIQAVITTEHRGSLGMHYTSVPNIMKVIEPLFLNDLNEDLKNAGDNKTKLKALLARIWNIKIFDPACGSGNFLIIAYKELRKLEMQIFRQLNEIAFSEISIGSFYGIEIDDFAHEIAILSLWLAEHQMNLEFFKEFGRTKPVLPLTETGNIIQGNACRLDWEKVCPKTDGDEIYILGNPPYLGARNQKENQKSDMALVFNGREEYKDSDYVLCWFLKAAKYIEGFNSKFAFVTTSSISQGSQIAYFWPEIYQREEEIYFAHQSFKWTNNAKDKAGIICVIIGVHNKKSGFKKLITPTLVRQVNNITPYLTEGKSIIVTEAKKSLSGLPLMVMGNMARDGGHLILSEIEKHDLISKYPNSEKLIKYFLGAEEYINGKIRFCLWIEDEDLDFALTIPEIKTRVENVYKFRIASKAKTTNQYSKISHKLAQRSHQDGHSIIIPRVSSERREYIPFGFLDNKTVISDSAQAIYNASPYVLGIISSKIHNVWVKSIGGYLGTSIRYSTSVCYNTFPFPIISNQQKQEIEQKVFSVLAARENHSEKTLAQLYDPEDMPADLREAHNQLDLTVERCYRNKPFESDEERLEYLFKLYEQMIAEEKANNGELVFEKQKTSKKALLKN